MARVFTREEFHDLVWSKPITHLAKEFAISDAALHKICRKHGIRNPPLGWWAKKAAGKKVKQTPLPEAKARTADKITIAGADLDRPRFRRETNEEDVHLGALPNWRHSVSTSRISMPRRSSIRPARAWAQATDRN